MATKTISITEDAYKRLACLKKNNESFSMVIERITGKKKISDFCGILSKESAEEYEKAIKKNREERNQLHKKRIKVIDEVMG
jgi:predicted CopG family antitoxin